MFTVSRLLPLRWRAYFRHPRIRALIVSAFWSVTLFYFVFCALILATRWYLLPQIDRYKDDIAGLLSDSLSSEVTIGEIRPRWDGLWPQLDLKEVRIQKTAQNTDEHDVLVLPSVSASFYWRTIFGEPLFRHLSVTNAELTVRKLTPTVYDVAGFEFDLAKLNTPDTGDEQKTDDPDAGRAFFKWLLKQGRIDFLDSSVRYMDLSQTEPTHTAVKDIELTFVKNLTNYSFGLQGVYDDGTKNTLDLRGTFSDSVLDAGNWKKFSGQIYAAASRINIAEVLRHISPVSDIVENGRGSARLWMDFADGRIEKLTSDVYLREVTVRFAEKVKPLHYDRFAARITETWDKNTIRVNAQNVRVVDAKGQRLPNIDLTGEFVLDSSHTHTASGKVGLSLVDLTVLRDTLDTVPLPPRLADWIRARSPKGNLTDVAFSWQGPVMAPSTWMLQSQFNGVTIDARESSGSQGMVPGIDNFSGHVEITPQTGLIALDSQKSSVTIPDVFKVPEMQFDRLSGLVSWNVGGSDSPLEVKFESFEAQNADVNARAQGSWRATGGAGTLDLTGTFDQARATAAWKYMPKVVGEGTQDWLQAGLVAGTATDGRFEIKGPLNEFPWTDSKDKTKEHFLIDMRVNRAAIDYVPSHKRTADGSFERAATWPLLTDINAQLTFEGPSMTVKADSARTFNTPVGPTTAVIPDLAAHEETTLIVDGQALGDLQTMFNYLEASPIAGFTGHAFDNTKATGQGDLKLRLEIPLLHAWDTRVKGSVKLVDNDITMAHPVPPITDVEGVVEFTHRGATARGVTGRAFGKDNVTANVTTTEDGTITISTSGQADIKNLTYFAPTPVLEETVKHLSGTLPFVSTVSIQKGSGVTVVAQSNLKGITSNLPVPLNKRADQLWGTRVSITPVTVTGNKGLIVHVNSGRRFDVKLELPLADSKLATRGSVAVGTTSDLPREGFNVAVSTPKLSTPQWLEPLKGLMDAIDKTGASSGTAAGSSSAAGLTNLTVQTDELTTRSTPLKAFDLNVKKNGASSWDVLLNSDKIAGKANYNTLGSGAVNFDLDRVHISKGTVELIRNFLENRSSGKTTVVQTQSSRKLPSLNGSIASFQYEDMHFGSVKLDATAATENRTEKLNINRLEVSSPAAKLTAYGSWSHSPTAGSNHEGQTRLSATLDLNDTGDLLTQLGFPGVIQDAQGSAKANLTYSGSPWSPQMNTLAGDMSVSLRRGSFEQIDVGPGGALLSLISFQSLLKRLTLDFTDLTQKGLSFDSFEGSSTITGGLSSTDNTRIVTQHGTMLLSGLTDFDKRTLNTHVTVLPNINAGNASLAVAFLNPAVGIGTFLAQLLLREPLSQLFKLEYDITGPWENPTIKKTGDVTDTVSEALAP